MSLPEYPEGLPRGNLAGYRLEHGDTFVRTQLASGRARQRRRFTSVPTEVRIEWLFSDGEFALFEGWFKHQITDGADWFTGPLKTSTGIQDYEQRFASMYTARALGGRHWRVDATLEIRERQTVPADWVLTAPLYIQHASIFDRAINREWPTA